MSSRTVYTTLADLADTGEIDTLSFGAGPTRFDSNTDDHHRVVCDVCGDIADVDVDGTCHFALVRLDGSTESATSIVFHGTCGTCTPRET